MIGQGIDVNSRGTSNATPLFWSMHNIAGFRRLLELGADPNVLFDDGGTVVHWAIEIKDPEFLKLVLKFNGDPNLRSRDDETPLFAAIGPGNQDKIDILSSANANINSQRQNGDTPIIVAASLGQIDVVYRLLEAAADYKITNRKNRSLATTIEFRRRTMAAGNAQTIWMGRVVAWLAQRVSA